MNQMNQMNQMHQDDTIDLFELADTLWIGKWKIISITFIVALIGVCAIVFMPSSFHVSTTIKPSQRSVFVSYTSINDILKSNGLALSEENLNGYLLDSETVFQIVVSEFNDYVEMISVLEKDSYVQNSLNKFPEDERRHKLIEFAKSFTISAPLKKEMDWNMSFEWHDANEGRELFNQALSATLANVKKTIYDDFTQLALSIASKNAREIEKLETSLDLVSETEKERTKKLIRYLKEQSAIAKELGIESNKLDADALSRSQTANVSLSISSKDVPYYLRGYKAIDKEISMIMSRTKEQQLLMADGYFRIREKLIEVESDLSSKQLQQNLSIIENDKPNDWIEYDLSLAESIPKKRAWLYLTLSILVGGIIGAMFVLLSSASRKRKEQIAEAWNKE